MISARVFGTCLLLMAGGSWSSSIQAVTCVVDGGEDTCSSVAGNWEYGSCVNANGGIINQGICEDVLLGRWVGGECIEKGFEQPFAAATEIAAMQMLDAEHRNSPACDVEGSEITDWLPDGTTSADFGIGSPPCFVESVWVGDIEKKSFKLHTVHTQDEFNNCSPIDLLYLVSREREFECPQGYVRDGVTMTCSKKQQEVCGVGNPTLPKLGTKVQSEVDFAPANSALAFRRYYSSESFDYRPVNTDASRSLPFGNHWNHSFNHQLFEISGSSHVLATVIRPNGRITTFGLDGWEVDGFKGAKDKLARLTDSGGNTIGWSLKTGEDEVESFNATGHLTEKQFPNGDVLTFDYADGSENFCANDWRVQAPNDCAPLEPNTLVSVSDRAGRTIELQYSADQVITAVIDPAGEVVTYDYTSAYDTNVYETNILQTVNFPDTSSKTYHHEDSDFPHFLTGITDERGVRYSTYTYDAQGRVVTSEHAGNTDFHEFDYQANGNTIITDPLGAERTYEYVEVNGVYKDAGVSQPCESCGTSSQSTTYDASGNVNLVTDFENVVTDYDYNNRGLLDQRIDAVGTSDERRIEHDYHATLNRATETRQYDAANTLVAKTTRTYNSRGQLLTETLVDVGDPSPVDRTTTYTYCEAVNESQGCPLLGLLRTIDPPGSAGMTTYNYYLSTEVTADHKLGDLKSVVNAKLHETKYNKYDGNGRVVEIEDANGIVTVLGYNTRGWLETRTVNGTQTTTFEYQPFGAIKKITQADGSYLEYDYDGAQRLVRITDAAGAYVEYTLDPAGNREEDGSYNAADKISDRSDASSIPWVVW